MGLREGEKNIKKMSLGLYLDAVEIEVVAALDGVWATAFGASKLHGLAALAQIDISAGLADKPGWFGPHDQLGALGGGASGKLRQIESQALRVGAGKGACHYQKPRYPCGWVGQGSHGCVKDGLGYRGFVHGASFGNG